MNDIYTIGHSTRSIDEFLDLLEEFEIRLLADVRQFPSSRRLPHFNQEPFRESLAARGVDYKHFLSLGGRRKTSSPESPNTGLRHEAFRSYADYMATDAFREGVDELLREAAARRSAMMCAEGVYWRCHRRLISDYLQLVHGVNVLHILGRHQLRPHRLTETAQLEPNSTPPRVIYPPPLFQET